MNPDKFNMYAAATIGSLLAFLLLGFFAGQVFGTRVHHEGEPLAFAVEVADEGGGEAAGSGEPDWPALVAAADVANGEKVFKKCPACHKVEDGADGVGPHLWGVVGRDIAGVAGYSYSEALTGLEGDWNLQSLSGFLANPKAFASGTKMSFAGIKDAQDRVDLIAYLNEADGSPITLAEAPSTEVAAASTEATTEATTTEATTTEAGTTEASSTETASTEAATTETTTAETTATETTSESTTSGTEVAATSTGETAAHAGGDAAAGKDVFRKCRACHVMEEGKNRVGPSLAGIVGSDKASVDGFKYSDALATAEGDWTAADLDAFLANPKEAVPGNKMTFPGVRDAEDRANLIAYLADPAAAEGGAAAESTETSGTETSGTETAATTESTSTESSGTTETTTETATAPAAGDVDFAAGNAEAGQKVFRKCRACHKADEEKNGVGPTLYGVIGRDKGSIEGFKYSDAMLGAEGNWTASDLNSYLADPKGFIPGNRMSFPGLKVEQDRLDVINYLNQADGSPDPLN